MKKLEIFCSDCQVLVIWCVNFVFSVHKYVVAMTTGSLKDSGTEYGQVSVCLIGVNGDTGMRRLTAPITKHRLPWQPGQEDIFIIEAVSIGKLKNVEVNFSSSKSGRWRS